MIVNIKLGVIMSEKRYLTKPRKMILSLFEDHPNASFSAKEIIENPEITVGEATVFRCLAHLTAQGFLKKYDSAEGALYQFNPKGECDRHLHLKCLACGRIIHLDCELMQAVGEHLAEEHRFAVDISRTVIHGVCADCQATD